MENYTEIDRKLRRVDIRAQGQWTLAQAEKWYSDMHEIREWSCESGLPITLFADLEGLVLHTQDVSRRIEESVLLMEKFPIERYALIVPSFLMRMQCRRLLSNVPHTYFDDADAAKKWLGWEPDRNGAQGAQPPIQQIMSVSQRGGFA
jgi:hypothetical protein